MSETIPVAGNIYIDTRDNYRSRFTGDISRIHPGYFIMFSLTGRKRFYLSPADFNNHYVELNILTNLIYE